MSLFNKRDTLVSKLSKVRALYSYLDKSDLSSRMSKYTEDSGVSAASTFYMNPRLVDDTLSIIDYEEGNIESDDPVPEKISRMLASLVILTRFYEAVKELTPQNISFLSKKLMLSDKEHYALTTKVLSDNALLDYIRVNFNQDFEQMTVASLAEDMVVGIHYDVKLELRDAQGQALTYLQENPKEHVLKQTFNYIEARDHFYNTYVYLAEGTEQENNKGK